LPQEVLARLSQLRSEQVHKAELATENNPGPTSASTRSGRLQRVQRDYYRELERCLDAGAGACWLRRPGIADLVASAVQFFDGERYCLDAWVVMPNHVHVVLWPEPYRTLSSILQSWKRFTAREANKRLGRIGETFWQRESFDHWIRNEDEHARCCRYVINNPVNAGLCSAPERWRWSSARQA